MQRHRFEVIPVVEPKEETSSKDPVPTIQIEHEIPTPPPLPASLESKNSNLLSTILKRKPFDRRRRATIAAALTQDKNSIKKSSSIDVLQDFAPIHEVEDSDVYSSIQSNSNETNPAKITNKFLHELRLKRHELREKAKNFTIDQRISLLRRENQRQILRAQDIFDVHFALHEETDSPSFPLSEIQIFTEESQEKIRNDIYNELNRQRDKQFDKHYRHLILGRSLLTFMTLLLTLMSFTLIYVVIDLYDRASFLDFKLPENEYLPIAPAQLKDFY